MHTELEYKVEKEEHTPSLYTVYCHNSKQYRILFWLKKIRLFFDITFAVSINFAMISYIACVVYCHKDIISFTARSI